MERVRGPGLDDLVDIVSKNGCLLLNATQRPDGSLDEQGEWTVKEIGKWMAVNGEAIYETRPWKQYGEGPTTFASSSFAEREARTYDGLSRMVEILDDNWTAEDQLLAWAMHFFTPLL